MQLSDDILLPLHIKSIKLTIMVQLNRLKEVLIEQNKTGKWLAETLGKDTATVSRWCNNRAQPSIETLANIAKLLEVDVRELINKTR